MEHKKQPFTKRKCTELASLCSYLIFDWVGGVLLLLAFLVWSADVQVLHVSSKDLGHTNA